MVLIRAILVLSAVSSAASTVLASIDEHLEKDVDMEEKPGGRRRNHGVLHASPTGPSARKFQDSLVDADLEADFKAKTDKLKVLMEEFRIAKDEMEQAKAEANEALRKVKTEAERRRKAEIERKAKEQAELQAQLEAERKEKAEILHRAERVASDLDTQEYAGRVSIGALVDVLMTLPKAVQNAAFMSTVERAQREVETAVESFLNITRSKTDRFATASAAASDVELGFLMARFFHDSAFRLKQLHSDVLKAVKDVKVVAPEKLKRAFMPIFGQLQASTVQLKVNATNLAKSSIAESCDQIAGIMSNVTDYDSKLTTVHEFIENVTEKLVPMLNQVMPVSDDVIQVVSSFLSVTRAESGGLKEAAHDIVTKVGPIVTDRVQCTWSASGPRLGLGLLAAASAIFGSWLHL